MIEAGLSRSGHARASSDSAVRVILVRFNAVAVILVGLWMSLDRMRTAGRSVDLTPTTGCICPLRSSRRSPVTERSGRLSGLAAVR